MEGKGGQERGREEAGKGRERRGEDSGREGKRGEGMRPPIWVKFTPLVQLCISAVAARTSLSRCFF